MRFNSGFRGNLQEVLALSRNSNNPFLKIKKYVSVKKFYFFLCMHGCVCMCQVVVVGIGSQSKMWDGWVLLLLSLVGLLFSVIVEGG